MSEVEVVVKGLSQISEQGVVATLLVIALIVVIWDRQRIIKAHKEMTDWFIAATKENGDKYAQVVTENTKAIGELSASIRMSSK